MAKALRISDLVTPFQSYFKSFQPHIERLLKKTPKDRDLMLVYSWFLINAGNLSFAVQYLEKCIKEHPQVS